jgi:DNA-binding beta-propeller fold protein YncE
MKALKTISLLLVFIFSLSVVSLGFKLPVKAVEKNPLKIEKIIGLSKEPGTFRNASGVAVAKDGTIFIADTGESQIEVYDSNYKYLRSFGSIGSGNDQFQYIQKIIFDQDENLYVLDSFLNRIQVFTKEGKFLRKFGEKGDKPGQLKSPQDIKFLKTGELLVLDYNNGLTVFSKEGMFINKFFKEEKYNSINLHYDAGTIDNKGYIYLHLLDAGTYDYEHLKFSQDGTFICKFISEGKEEKNITRKLYYMTNEDKNFYLVDGNIVKKFEILDDPNRPLQFVETVIKKPDSTTDKTAITNPAALECSKQKLYYLDWALNRLVIVSDKKEILGIIQSPIMEYGNLFPKNEKPMDTFSSPRGITIGPDNNFYIVNAFFNKVSIFDSNWKEINSFGKPITGNRKTLGELRVPTDIVFDKQGFCYVSDPDYGNESIEIFAKDHTPFRSMNFEKGNPFGLALNSSGNLVVGEMYPDSIEIFDISKVDEKKITKKKTLSVTGESLVDLDIDEQDNMIVSLFYSHEIKWIDTDGLEFRKVGGQKEDEEENKQTERVINYPRGIFRDGGGNVYVAEPYNGRIQKFTSNGESIWKSDLDWYSLAYMTMDQYGKLYVTDMVHNVVLVISDETAVPPVPLIPKPLQTEAKFSFQISKESIIEDDIFTVNINAENLEKCSSLKLSIHFPEQLISYQSIQISDLLKDSNFKILDTFVNEGLVICSLKSTKNIDVTDSGILLSIQFSANKAGSGSIDFDKIEITNTMGREVLIKEKVDLPFTILAKDKTPPILKLLPIPESVYEPTIQIQGETEVDAIVSINQKTVPVKPDGTFETIVDLQKGTNTIIVTATDKAGNQSKSSLSVIFKEKIVIKMIVGSKVIIVKGQPGTLDSEPFIDKSSGRTMVPLRAVSEPLEAKIDYNAEERNITVYVGETTIKLWIGKPKALVNGKEVSIDAQKPVSPVIVKGRTFLPLRFIAKTFGFKVDWDPKTLGITLTFPNPDQK